jgi:hypothetical protein
MTQPLLSASRQLAVGAGRSGAVCAWDAEPIAEPSLELLLLLPPMTNSAYRFGRYEESSARRAAAALISAVPGGLAAGDDAGRPRTVSRAARPSRTGRGRR